VELAQARLSGQGDTVTTIGATRPLLFSFFEVLGDYFTEQVNKEGNRIMGYRETPEQLLRLHEAHVCFICNGRKGFGFDEQIVKLR